MESRHIAPSFVHREIDQKKEEIRNSTVLHLNKFKARRKRLSTSESVDSKLKVDGTKINQRMKLFRMTGTQIKLYQTQINRRNFLQKRYFCQQLIYFMRNIVYQLSGDPQ